VYNLGIHDCSSETAYMHVWDETTASRGSQEIASCLRKYLASSGNQGSKTNLILWSDSCGGQNRNIKVALRLLEFVQDPSVSYNIITQKFLESGHSFLPNDSDFGDIEKRLKHHSEVYIPQQYYDVIREARSSSKPFKVVEMTQDDFFSTATLEKAIVNRKTSTSKEPISWMNAKQIQVRRDHPLFLFFRYTHDPLPDDAWIEISLAKRGQKIAGIIGTKLFDAPRSITTAKKKDLTSLLPLVPPIHHHFFQSIRAGGKAENDVDGHRAELDFEVEDE